MIHAEMPMFFVRYAERRGGRTRRLGHFLRRADAVEAAGALRHCGYFEIRVVVRRGLTQPVRTRPR